MLRHFVQDPMLIMGALTSTFIYGENKKTEGLKCKVKLNQRLLFGACWFTFHTVVASRANRKISPLIQC